MSGKMTLYPATFSLYLFLQQYHLRAIVKNPIKPPLCLLILIIDLWASTQGEGGGVSYDYRMECSVLLFNWIILNSVQYIIFLLLL